MTFNTTGLSEKSATSAQVRADWPSATAIISEAAYARNKRKSFNNLGSGWPLE